MGKSKPAHIPWQVKENKTYNKSKTGEEMKQEKFNPTQSKYKKLFQGHMTQTQVLSTTQHIQFCWNMQQMVAQWIVENHGPKNIWKWLSVVDHISQPHPQW